MTNSGRTFHNVPICAGTVELQQASHGPDCKQADQATCVEQVLE